MPRPMMSGPTQAQTRKALSMQRIMDVRSRFLKRLPDGTSVFECSVAGTPRVPGEQVVYLAALDKTGRVVRAASRSFPDNDPPFALMVPKKGGHGSASSPRGWPQWVNERVARQFVMGENAPGVGQAGKLPPPTDDSIGGSGF